MIRGRVTANTRARHIQRHPPVRLFSQAHSIELSLRESGSPVRPRQAAHRERQGQTRRRPNTMGIRSWFCSQPPPQQSFADQAAKVAGNKARAAKHHRVLGHKLGELPKGHETCIFATGCFWGRYGTRPAPHPAARRCNPTTRLSAPPHTQYTPAPLASGGARVDGG